MSEFDRRWYADPRLHSEDYLLLFPLPGAEETARQVEGLVRLLAVPTGSRVLDLACGWGRVALPLAQRGYRVTGLDLSEAFLVRARRDAKEAGLDIDFRRADMREIPFVGEFDAVIMMCSAFGALESDEEDEKVLHAVARALRPGGRFLIDHMNREYLVRHHEAHRWREASDGTPVLEDVSVDVLASRNRIRWTAVAPDGCRRHGRVDVGVYTLREFVGMLGRAGLRFRQVWGGFNGSDYSLDSRRMIVLAEKGERAGKG